MSDGGFVYDAAHYLDDIKEHFIAGDINIVQALEAAALLGIGRAVDISQQWHVALIALGHEELALRFVHVNANMSKAGVGVTLGTNPNDPWEASDASPEERRVMDIATYACLRRLGAAAEIIDGRLVIHAPPEGEDEDVISQFIKELEELPGEDPDQKGWGKWIT